MSGRWDLGIYDRDGQPISFEEWAMLHGDPFYGIVAKTAIGDVQVSTVWLGFDHGMPDEPPLIFETMVFGVIREADDGLLVVRHEADDYVRRYSTETAAMLGHRETVEALTLREIDPVKEESDER